MVNQRRSFTRLLNGYHFTDVEHTVPALICTYHPAIQAYQPILKQGHSTGKHKSFQAIEPVAIGCKAACEPV
jgi:hypothetical protein